MRDCRSCSNRSFASFRLTSNADSAGTLFYSNPVKKWKITTYDGYAAYRNYRKKRDAAFSIYLTGFSSGKSLLD